LFRNGVFTVVVLLKRTSVYEKHQKTIQALTQENSPKHKEKKWSSLPVDSLFFVD
jgi:hypothetical protein